MVTLLTRGAGVLVKSLAGLSCTQAARCSSLHGALAAVQCTTARWFSKSIDGHKFPVYPPVRECPKRPPSAFFRFLNEERPGMTKEHPGMPVTVITKMVSEKWKALSKAEQQVYVDAAKGEAMKYKDDVQEYKKSLDPMDLKMLNEIKNAKLKKKRARQQRKAVKALGKPKASRNAFSFFMAKRFLERGDTPANVLVKQLKYEWLDMPSSQKQVYIQLMEDDKVRYQTEINAWEDQMIAIGRGDVIRYSRRMKLNSPRVRTNKGEKKALDPEGNFWEHGSKNEE